MRRQSPDRQDPGVEGGADLRRRGDPTTSAPDDALGTSWPGTERGRRCRSSKSRMEFRAAGPEIRQEPPARPDRKKAEIVVAAFGRRGRSERVGGFAAHTPACSNPLSDQWRAATAVPPWRPLRRSAPRSSMWFRLASAPMTSAVTAGSGWWARKASASRIAPVSP